MKEIWQDIRMRGGTKEFLVDQSNKHKIPDLLEAENTAFASNKLLLLKEQQIQEHGSVDYDVVLNTWKEWVNQSIVKRLIQKEQGE